MLKLCDTEFKLFYDFISVREHFAVVGHKEPDGDSISSSLVIADLLKKMGKHCQVLCAGPFKRCETKKYEKLFLSEYTPPAQKEKTGLFIVDCSQRSRLGELIEKQVSELDAFVIDHHKTSVLDDKNHIIDSTAPATVCIIQQLYEHFFGEPSKEIAELLFFGLSTDTGFFRFLDNKSSDVFYSAGRLVKAGVDPRRAYEHMNNNKPFMTRKLLSVALDRIGVHCGGKFLTTYETIEDTQKYGRDGRDTDMLYQILMATERVRAVAVFRQESETNCTVGLRSNGDFDVSAIAARFGGGGHKNAAGLSTEGSLDVIMQKIIAEFEKIFKK
ncbi:bifunctional oligoribonuclease/PAP phosphatase NrnA [Treponema sp. OMZ 840]|uniref:DHH family phosphoesterase n=1 Tax=Treponema sp. OMZ 840 TaxID=244313 RepID=UPI003D9300AF